jgi:hypothetical protein
MRMRNALFTLTIVAMLTACGGGAEPANDPSHVPSPTTPLAPNGPAEAPLSTDATQPPSGAAVAPTPAPTEGKCKSAEMPAAAKDYDSCLNGCKGLDDKVPPGSKCISAKTSCVSQCSTKYKK